MVIIVLNSFLASLSQMIEVLVTQASPNALELAVAPDSLSRYRRSVVFLLC